MKRILSNFKDGNGASVFFHTWAHQVGKTPRPLHPDVCSAIHPSLPAGTKRFMQVNWAFLLNIEWKSSPLSTPKIINGGRLRKHHLFLKGKGISSWRLKEKRLRKKKNSVNCLAPSIERGITWLLYLSYGVFVLITLSIGWTKIKEKEKAKAKLRSTFQA